MLQDDCLPLVVWECLDRFKKKRRLFVSLNNFTGRRIVRNENFWLWESEGKPYVDTIIMRWIESREVGEIVMRKLRSVDQVAFVRFASVYRQFQDVHAFREEIERLEGQLTPEAQRQQLDLLDEDT